MDQYYQKTCPKGLDLLMQCKSSSRKRTWDTINQRPTAQDILSKIPASRSSLDLKHRSLPGLGHPYWENIRDHLTMNYMPPSLDINLNINNEPVSPELMERYVKHLQDLWNTEKSTKRKFMILFEHCQSCNTSSGIPVLRIPVTAQDPQHYQNGADLSNENVVLFHGTRQPLIPYICKEGLKSSIRSHDVTGLWTNSNVETSLAWTSSIFDSVPSLALEIIAPRYAIRQNRRIKSGNPERHVVELYRNQELPAVHIASIIVTLPTIERIQFNAELKNVLNETCKWMIDRSTRSANDINYQKLCTIMLGLCSFRYAYVGTPGALQIDFGAIWDVLPKCIILPSIHFVAAVHYLVQLTSYENKKRRLATINAAMLPPPMYKFLVTKAPGIQFFWNTAAAPAGSIESWTSFEMVPVQKWGPITELVEKQNTKIFLQAAKNSWATNNPA